MSVSASSLTLLDVLRAAPGDRVALVEPDGDDGVVTYDALRQRVVEMAGALAACGIGSGDRVAIALPNGLPLVVVILAASAAGTAAPLNPAYRYEEVRFYLQDTGAKLVVLPEGGADDARRAAADGEVPVMTAEALGAAGRARQGPVREPAPQDVALVLHTSGSTGRPKRVPLRHGNLAVSAGNVVGTYQRAPGDAAPSVLP